MSTTKEEFFAAEISKQISSLEGLLKELESQPKDDAQLLKHIRTVEDQIRKLRIHLED